MLNMIQMSLIPLQTHSQFQQMVNAAFDTKTPNTHNTESLANYIMRSDLPSQHASVLRQACLDFLEGKPGSAKNSPAKNSAETKSPNVPPLPFSPSTFFAANAGAIKVDDPKRTVNSSGLALRSFSSSTSPERNTSLPFVMCAVYITADFKDEKAQTIANYLLGCIYEFHLQDDQKNTTQVLQRYQNAAHKNYAPALIRLGHCYLTGKYVEKNERVAFVLYRTAAAQHFVLGQLSVGLCYLGGAGVARNWAEALRYLRMAAVSADPAAQGWLVRMSQDEKKAAGYVDDALLYMQSRTIQPDSARASAAKSLRKSLELEFYFDDNFKTDVLSKLRDLSNAKPYNHTVCYHAAIAHKDETFFSRCTKDNPQAVFTLIDQDDSLSNSASRNTLAQPLSMHLLSSIESKQFVIEVKADISYANNPSSLFRYRRPRHQCLRTDISEQAVRIAKLFLQSSRVADYAWLFQWIEERRLEAQNPNLMPGRVPEDAINAIDMWITILQRQEIDPMAQMALQMLSSSYRPRTYQEFQANYRSLRQSNTSIIYSPS